MEMEVTKSVKQESRHFSDERFKTDNKCYVVKSIRLMMYLVRKGFNVVNVIDDITI